MPRRGNKVIVSVWKCSECGDQTGQTYLNKLNNPKLENKRYCAKCRKHTLQITKAESSGSKGLARNK